MSSQLIVKGASYLTKYLTTFTENAKFKIVKSVFKWI